MDTKIRTSRLANLITQDRPTWNTLLLSLSPARTPRPSLLPLPTAHSGILPTHLKGYRNMAPPRRDRLVCSASRPTPIPLPIPRIAAIPARSPGDIVSRHHHKSTFLSPLALEHKAVPARRASAAAAHTCGVSVEPSGLGDEG